jgi:predicted outer membrane protein
MQAAAATGLILCMTTGLKAQNYYPNDQLQCGGVTLPGSGNVSQLPGMPLPLGATSPGSPAAVYAPPLAEQNQFVAPDATPAREFIAESARQLNTDLAMADLAASKAQSSGVRDLAQHIKTEDTDKLGQLQGLATAYSMTLPQGMSEKYAEEMGRLQNASSADFDREYTTSQLRCEVKQINHAERAADRITGQADVATFAIVNLPSLRHEVQRTEKVAISAGVDQATVAGILNNLPAEDQGIADNVTGLQNGVAIR